MFIQGKRYITKKGKVRVYYSLVEIRYVDGKRKKRTLLNLGQEFSLPRESWSKVTALVQESFDGQSSVELEALATPESRMARKIIHRLQAAGYRAEPSLDPYKSIAIQRIEYPPNANRSVGGERVVLRALDLLDVDGALEKLGKTPPAIRKIKTCIAVRMLKPSSRPITKWLWHDSALLELLRVESRPITEGRLSQTAQGLWAKRGRVLGALRGVGPDPTGTLASRHYRDFTFDNIPSNGADDASRAGMIILLLNEHGYVRGCKLLRSPKNYLATVGRIKASNDVLVVRAGQVTDQQLFRWTRGGIKWLCVNFGDATPTEPIAWELANFSTELRLHEYRYGSREPLSEAVEAECLRFEEALSSLNKNLSVPNRPSKWQTVKRHIAALQDEYKQAGDLYDIHLSRARADKVASIDYERVSEHHAASSPYRYTLRTNLMDWDQDQLVQFYLRLLDNRRIIQALNHGICPTIDVQVQSVESKKGFWTIMLMAYMAVRVVEQVLSEKGINAEWSALRKQLSRWQRITSILTGSDATRYLERQDTQVELDLQKITTALGISPSRHLKRSVYRL